MNAGRRSLRLGSFTAKAELSAISELPDRGRALCRGYIESITITPVNASPEFSAVVTDVDKYAPRQRRRSVTDNANPGSDTKAVGTKAAGTKAAGTKAVVTKTVGAKPVSQKKPGNRVRLVWLGQRTVPGIEAGTELRFEGMVARREGMPTVFNPRYEIIGKAEFQEYPA